MNLMWLLCNERNHSFLIHYSNIWSTHFQWENEKKIIKGHFCLWFSLLYPFIRSCKFVITRAYNMAHDENAMNPKYILGSVRSCHRCSCCNIHGKIPVLESLFHKELQSNFIKKDFNTGVFLWILRNS